MHIKRQLGQFFTKNSDYILKGLEQFVKNKEVTDPFAGSGDLLLWAKKHGAKSILGYDCDKNLVDNKIVFFGDSLENPRQYDFVITNPPYLYQNKMADDLVLRYSKHTDLYQLALEKIANSEEGIVIVPINFLSAENSKYIRQIFLDKFNIIKINYFTEQVFLDTTYNVIAFYYRKKNRHSNKMILHFNIYPKGEQKEIAIYKRFNWQIGGDFIAEVRKYSNVLNITRLEEEDLKQGTFSINTAYNHLNTVKHFYVDRGTLEKVRHNIIILKAIDAGTSDGKICLDDIRRYGLDALVSIKTSRNQINLIFPSEITVEEQEELIELFNTELEEKRKKYCSLFMTNFRDKGRKRISFNFVYSFINYLYFNRMKKSGYGFENSLFGGIT